MSTDLNEQVALLRANLKRLNDVFTSRLDEMSVSISTMNTLVTQLSQVVQNLQANPSNSYFDISSSGDVKDQSDILDVTMPNTLWVSSPNQFYGANMVISNKQYPAKSELSFNITNNGHLSSIRNEISQNGEGDTRCFTHIMNGENGNYRELRIDGDTGTTVTGSFAVIGDCFNNTGSWQVLSDKNVKSDLVLADASICLDAINKLKLYRYRYIDDYNFSDDGHQLGLLTSDVKQIFPKSVKTSVVTDKKGIVTKVETMNYEQINRSVIGAIQQLSYDIKSVKDKLNAIFK